MTLQELRASPHLSSSSISDYMECVFCISSAEWIGYLLKGTSYNMVFVLLFIKPWKNTIRPR